MNQKGKVTASTMKEYHVSCGVLACHLNEAAHEFNMTDAIRTFRQLGWRRRSGMWVCSGHSKNVPR